MFIHLFAIPTHAQDCTAQQLEKIEYAVDIFGEHYVQKNYRSAQHIRSTFSSCNYSQAKQSFDLDIVITWYGGFSNKTYEISGPMRFSLADKSVDFIETDKNENAKSKSWIRHVPQSKFFDWIIALCQSIVQFYKSLF